MADEWTSDTGYEVTGFKSANGISTVAFNERKRDPRLCIAKDQTCKGFHTKDSKYCAGHERAMKAGK